MHIGFSFKPKFLLVVLAVILGIVGFCVDAFASEVPEDVPDWALVPALEPGEDADRGYTTVYDMDGSVLYTDDPALKVESNNTETPSNTVVINAAPAAEAAASETYTYQRGEHTGLAGLDFCWIGGCLAFLILFYSFFRLLGGVFLGRSK